MRESFAIDGSAEHISGGLHSVDIRAKLIITLAASVSSVAISGLYPQLMLFSFSFLYAASMRKVKILAIAYAFIFFIAALAVICMLVINMFVPIMKSASYTSLVIPFLRMATMINVILPLAFTTRIQSVLTALKSLRLALYIYLPVAVMIRFIPTFINDIKQVAETAKIRGVKITPAGFITKPVFMTRLLFMPLLFRSLRTSEELGIAAELKGLGLNDDMTPYKSLEWKGTDTRILIAAALVIVCASAAQIIIGTPEGMRGMP